MSAELEPSGSDAPDVTRAPRGELAASQLVSAVARLGDLAERHYLELKGPPDLASRASLHKVAKFILGAANRSPDRAAEAFEGYGVMVVGVTAQGAEGVPSVEMLTMSKVIHQFLGARGPRWDIVRVPVVERSDRQVIVVLVDPPRLGDPIFVCRENGDGLQSGRVYYRADGETREARADEMDELVRRAAAGTIAAVDLTVTVRGSVASLDVDDARTIEAFVAATRDRLLHALPRPGSSAPAPAFLAPDAVARLRALRGEGLMGAGAMSSLLGEFEPEKRSEESYRDEIDRWEQAFREAWPRSVELMASMVLEPNEITVKNGAKTFLHDVEVAVHLEGAVEPIRPGYYLNGKITWRDLKLPRPPRAWGPQKRTTGLAFDYAANAATASASANHVYAAVAADTTWTASGSVDVKVEVGDLRPEDTYESADEKAVLVIREGTPPAVHGTWRATMRGYNEVFSGRVEVETIAPDLLTGHLRRFLSLD